LRIKDDFCSLEKNFEKGIDAAVELKQIKECFQNQHNKRIKRAMFNLLILLNISLPLHKLFLLY
jgi:hypothetical protein